MHVYMQCIDVCTYVRMCVCGVCGNVTYFCIYVCDACCIYECMYECMLGCVH